MRWLFFPLKSFELDFFFSPFPIFSRSILSPTNARHYRGRSESDDTISCIRKFYLMIINVSLNSKNDVRKIKEFLNRASFSFLIYRTFTFPPLQFDALVVVVVSEWQLRMSLRFAAAAQSDSIWWGSEKRSEIKTKISANLRIVTLIRFSPSLVYTHLSLIRYWIIISCTHHMKLQRTSWVETCLSMNFFVYFSRCNTSRNTWDNSLSFSVSSFSPLWRRHRRTELNCLIHHFFLAVHLTHSTLSRCLMSISVMTNERWKISFSSTFFFSDANLSVFL